MSFADDFTGPAGSAVDSSKWSYQTSSGWNGGTQKQYYRSGTANAALTGNGTLLITAKGGSYTGPDHKSADYTSARLISKQSVLYGTMSARIRLTGSPGAWPGFWSMGANYPQVGWPACGEIDTMETVNQYPNLYGSFHGPVAGASRGTAYNAGKMISPTGGLGTGWHVYSANWTPTSVTFLLDGTAYDTVNKADLPAGNMWALNSPENLILNIAVGGSMPGPAVAAPADFHATMEVDYVHVTTTNNNNNNNNTTVNTRTNTAPTKATAKKTEPVRATVRSITVVQRKHHRYVRVIISTREMVSATVAATVAGRRVSATRQCRSGRYTTIWRRVSKLKARSGRVHVVVTVRSPRGVRTQASRWLRLM